MFFISEDTFAPDLVFYFIYLIAGLVVPLFLNSFSWFIALVY